MREVLCTAYKSQIPSKFVGRITECRMYSNDLKSHFYSHDQVSNKINSSFSKLFYEEIIKFLDKQFDSLCNEMLGAIIIDNIEVEGATNALYRIANNPDKKETASKKEISAIL